MFFSLPSFSSAAEEFELEFVQYQLCNYSAIKQQYCDENQDYEWISGTVKIRLSNDSLVSFVFQKKKYSFRYNRIRQDYNSDGDSIVVVSGQNQKGSKFILVLGKDYFNFINSKKWGMYFLREKKKGAKKSDLKKRNFGKITYTAQSMAVCEYDKKTDSYNGNCKFDNFETTLKIDLRTKMRRDNLYLAVDTLPEINVIGVEDSQMDDGTNVSIYKGFDSDGSNVYVVIAPNYFNVVSDEYKVSFSEEKVSDELVSKKSYSGSGVAIAPDILITNAHVIENMSKLAISLDGQYIENDGYEIVGQLTDDVLDLAILRVKGAKLNSCPMSTKEPELGADVLVYGYPQIQYQGEDLKVTKGIVSGKNGFQGKKTMFQIDAAIQHGNSGGPIVSKGKIIGLATAFLKDSQNANAGIKASKIYHLLQFYDVVPKSTTNDFSKCTYMLVGE